MSCRKSIHALPAELLEQIQEYVEGEVIYIPKKKSSKKCWGCLLYTSDAADE